MKRDGVATPTDISAIGGHEGFFAFCRERHAIYVRKEVEGWPRPWTTDPILHRFRFTNIFRELDKVTIWFRKNIRERYDRGDPFETMMAVAVFRWFNRIETGEAIFLKTDAFDQFMRTMDTTPMLHAMYDHIGPNGPFVTGAHMVWAKPGYKLHEGVLWGIRNFATQKMYDNDDASMSRRMANLMAEVPGGYKLETAYDVVTGTYDGMGPFLTYELVTDWRQTSLLNQAPDIMTWASPGPGSTRGLNFIHGRKLRSSYSREKMIQEMRDLLEMSRDPRYWPSEYPAMEMRDVEHALCEYFKYSRVTIGDGYPRGVYK